MRSAAYSIPLLVLTLTATNNLAAQQSGDLPPGVTREQMWYAPSASDWNKPTLIPWQRTWSDAVALSEQSQKAILVCVNMDGEIASEHWAGIRYRQPEIAALFEQYVCVIASTFRHNPRDYDSNGKRISCPRFGTVTCGEHVWMEPTVFGKYLEETRVAPRHIMVELDGSETYDIYYANNIDSIVARVEKGIAERTIQPNDPPRGDRTLAELVASPDAEDRAKVEETWKDGDRQTRQEILAAASALGADVPIDLLRQAVYGFDRELNAKALDMLTISSRDKAVGLIDDLLRGPLDSNRRVALISALERLGDQVPMAKRLAAVHHGLSSRSELLDFEAWSEGLAGGKTSDNSSESAVLLAEAVRVENLRALQSPNPRVRKVAKELFRQARTAGQADLATDNKSWLAHAIVAISNRYLAEDDSVVSSARQAVILLPPGEASWNAYAVLSIFAEARREAILSAASNNVSWPPEWLSEVQSTYSVLAQHPFNTDAEVALQYDFLVRLRAMPTASQALQNGLELYPDSWPLHQRFRRLLLADQGIDGIESGYATWLDRDDAPQYLRWYAAQASIFTAEQLRRVNRLADADSSYLHALELFAQQQQTDPETTDSSAPYEVLAMAGRARLALENGDVLGAHQLILSAFSHQPDASANLDGLNVSPVGTAKKILAALQAGGSDMHALELQQALDALGERNTGLLELPAFEQRR